VGIPGIKEKWKFFAGSICVLVIILAWMSGGFGKSESELENVIETKIDTTVSNETGEVEQKRESANKIEMAGQDTLPVSSAIKQEFCSIIKNWIVSLCVPVFSFGTKDEGTAGHTLLEEAILAELPVFSYMLKEAPKELPIQDDATWQRLLVGEGDELVEEDMDEQVVSETTTKVEEAMTLDEAFEKENAGVRDGQEKINENTTEEMITDTFIPHEKQMTYNLENYQDFTTLFETFYAMDSNTMIGREQLNLDSLLTPDVLIDKNAAGPQILIYHTHSQETFVDSIPGDRTTSIVGAGEKLAKLLTETYGYSVLHHTGEYDVGDRDNAYSKSLPALEQLLADNPSIQVVIDLHRDGVAEDTKLAVDLDGRPTAQFMFFNGLSRTKNTGDIDYLYNPYQADNLALSFRMQLAADEYYPGLARRIYLNGYRYNMHLRPSLLIELGAQTNTVEEIMNAVDPLAHVLDLVFSGKEAK